MLFVDAIFFILSKWCRSISSFYLLVARSRRHVTLNKLLKNLDKRPHRRGHPPNIAPSPPNTWFFPLSESIFRDTPDGISICSAVFAWLAVVTNIHTDHGTSVAIGRVFALRACDAA